MHTGFTVAACRGCSRGTARHGSPQARHGTASPARLHCDSPSCSFTLHEPESLPAELPAPLCLLLCVCWAFWGTFPTRDPLIPKYSKKRSSPAAFNVFFPRAEPCALSSHGDSPKSSPGSSARAAQPRKGIWKKQEEMKSSW